MKVNQKKKPPVCSIPLMFSATGPVACKRGLTGLVHEGTAVDIVNLDFIKASDTVSHIVSPIDSHREGDGIWADSETDSEVV